MPAYQTIRKAASLLNPEPWVDLRTGELVANLRCAAALARKEGMHGVAERVDNDADAIDRIFAGAGVLRLTRAPDQ